MVAVLDRRLLTKSYGSFILRSLPDMWPTTDGQVVRASLENLAAVLPADRTSDTMDVPHVR